MKNAAYLNGERQLMERRAYVASTTFAQRRAAEAGDYREECIAYALATGIAPYGSTSEVDQDAERSARRARWERRKAKRS